MAPFLHEKLAYLTMIRITDLRINPQWACDVLFIRPGIIIGTSMRHTIFLRPSCYIDGTSMKHKSFVYSLWCIDS